MTVLNKQDINMNQKKKKKLEKMGWTIGAAKKFLGLSDAESTLIELKLTLSQNLKQMRTKHGSTQVQLAELLKSSQSRVAKMERGDTSVSFDLLLRSLIALGATQRDLARIIATVR